MHPLDRLFNPGSVAVIGASTASNKAGGRRWRTLVEGGFKGTLYPINPTASQILGHAAYRSIDDVPGEVDLAFVLVRSELVPDVVRRCANLGIPAVVVISAGFGETGPSGKQLEQQLVAELRQRGGRMVGPNCAGLFSASGRVNLLGWKVTIGSIALISQSGNIALDFCQLASAKGLGFSKIVTFGNGADIRLAEYVEYFFSDPETRTILAYVEGFRSMEGRELWSLMRNHPAPKPVIIVKPGHTESGRRAARSHTGALAGENRIVDSALKQCGVLRTSDIEEAWEAAAAISTLPPLRRGTVAVIADGGGHATVISDALGQAGLEMPDLSATTRNSIAALLPARSAIGNPVDFAGLAEEEPEVVPRVLEVCLADEEIGGAILAGHFGGYFKLADEELGERESRAARDVVKAVQRHGKPVAVHSIYADQPLPALDELRRSGIPLYRSAEASARAMGNVWRQAAAGKGIGGPHLPRRSHPDRDAVFAILNEAGTDALLLEPETRKLLHAYGIAIPPFRVSTSAGETAEAARNFGGLVAIKLIADGIVHKSDAGGIALNVSGPSNAAEWHQKLVGTADPSRRMRVLVTPMIPGGIEAVVGAFRDDQFGPVVMFGLGGIFVEALDDVAFRLAPLERRDTQAMISEVRAHRIFERIRGRPPSDLPALEDLLIRVSELITDHEEIAELDLNPVFLLAQGVAVADAHCVLR